MSVLRFPNEGAGWLLLGVEECFGKIEKSLD